jgi:hypothetical protein
MEREVIKMEIAEYRWVSELGSSTKAQNLSASSLVSCAADFRP